MRQVDGEGCGKVGADPDGVRQRIGRFEEGGKYTSWDNG